MSDRNNNQHPTHTRAQSSEGFPSRLAALIGDSSVRAFARKAGVSDTFLRQCLAGRTEPTRTKLIALAGAGGSNVEWLATGHGSRNPITAPAVETASEELDHTLLEAVVTAVEQALDELGRALSAERKASLISALYAEHAGKEATAISHDEIRRLVSRAP